MLNDEIKINKFKNDKKKQSQLALTFETGVTSHEFNTNPTEFQLKKKITNQNSKKNRENTNLKKGEKLNIPE